MRKLALGLSLTGCLLVPTTSLALGLGSIQVSTTLNQPLKADIELVGTSPSEVQGISVKLASPTLFQQVGIPRPGYLGNLQFKVERNGNGQPYIRVSTKGPIMQPFLDFLLELNWSGGRLLREYTVLLNPPNYMNGKPEVAVTAPSSASAPLVRHTLTTEPSHAAAQPAAKRTAPSTSTVSAYHVRKGDTLTGVALRMRPNSAVSVNRMMIALLRTNPSAFIKGNINGLKQGYVLRMPPGSTLSAITQGEATAEVNRQNGLWREYAARMAGRTIAQSQLKSTGESTGAQSPKRVPSATRAGNASQLRIMGTQASSSGEKGASKVSLNTAKLKHQLALAEETAASNHQRITNLQSRLTALQSIVDKQQKLIALKNQQLAALQQKLGANVTPSATLAASATQAAPSSAPAASPSLATPASAAAAASVAVPAAVQSAAQKPKPPAVKPKPAVPAPKPAPQASLISDLLSSPNLLGGVGAVVLLLLVLLWLVVRRSNKAKEEARQITPEITDEPDSLFDTVDEEDESTEVPTAEEFGEEDEPAFGEADQGIVAEAPAESASGEENEIKSEDPGASDDVLAEADVYIAYGLYQQAEDVLRKALENDSRRNDYRAKLLECHFGAKNVSEFEREAKELHDTLPHPEVDPLWIRVAALGKELVPANPLFTGTDTGTLTAADVMASDQSSDALDLGGAEFDLGDLADVEADKDFDLGEPEETSSIVELPADEEDAFELGDLELGEDQGSHQTASDIGAQEEDDDGTLNFDGLDLELEEDPATSTQTRTLEAPDATAEKEEQSLPVEDQLEGLDFDLEDLDITTDDEQTEGGADESDSRLDLDIGDLQAVDEDGHVEEDDFESLDLDTGAFDLEAETSSLDFPTEDGDTQTASVEDLQRAAEESEPDQGLSLEELPSPEAGIEAEEAVVADGDDAIEDGIGDEVATKLDLARAYLDMGDTEGAQSTLEEVLAEGDDVQKQQAEELLRQLD